MFAREWKLNTPAEVQPWGWLTIDFWSPLVITPLYVALTQAHPAFAQPYVALRQWALPTLNSYAGKPLPLTAPVWTKAEARAACAIVLAVLFAGRAIYNFGSWEAVVAAKKRPLKAKQRVSNGKSMGR